MLDLLGTFSGIRDLSHDRELAASLGDMVVAWSRAERALIGLLHKVADIPWPMAAAAYYRIPTFESRCKTIVAMLAEWQTAEFDCEALQRTVFKMKSLAGARNGWVHGSWARAQGTNKTVIFDYREAAATGKRRRPVKSADVFGHIDAVNRRTDELIQLLQPRPLSLT